MPAVHNGAVTTFYASITGPDGDRVFTQESGWSSDAARLHRWVVNHPDRTHLRDLVFRLEATGSQVAAALDGWDHLTGEARYTVEVDEY